jgi:hypothetical protein
MAEVTRRSHSMSYHRRRTPLDTASPPGDDRIQAQERPHAAPLTPEPHTPGARPMLTTLRRAYAGRLTKDQQRAFRRFQSSKFRRTQALLYGTLFGRSLNTLGLLYGTDKGSWHGYLDVYQSLFAPIRRKRLTLLEIGVGGTEEPWTGGGSLRMWRAYFPRARIVALDIHDKSPHDERRIKTVVGSQADPTVLCALDRAHGPFDIVIDDGSHIGAHIITTFETLFPRLRPGGYYLAEDLHFASYDPDRFEDVDCLGDRDNPMGFFQSLVHRPNKRDLPEWFATWSAADDIASIAFHPRLVAVRKAGAP